MGLQRALASIQQASDRRELTERKLRAQLEKELQTLRYAHTQRVMGLQRALASIQQASDRRELTERKLRAQLEKELQTLSDSKPKYETNNQDRSSHSIIFSTVQVIHFLPSLTNTLLPVTKPKIAKRQDRCYKPKYSLQSGRV
ncbi:hypothetical protein NE865_13399 [Phthorimaea operculella]|nr:hypothetical protein NE865_13399 [Phthorimaea operculella]